MRKLVCITFTLFLITTAFSQELPSKVAKLSRDADLILTGKVTGQKSEWDENKTKIITKVKVTVDEYLKSNGNQEITVTHPGGEVGEIGELYSHMPRFFNNEEVLLFLKNYKQDSFKVLHGEEGKVTLYKDRISGEKITSSNKKISSLKREIKKYIGAE